MQKTTKIVIGVIAAVLVVCVVVLSQSEFFQGRLRLWKGQVAPMEYFLYKNKIVSAVISPVTSPVPSVVVSNVSSPAGTSRVASVVVSPVASAVASAVTVDKKMASELDVKKLKDLTGSILKSIEKEDYKKNTDKFTSKAKEYYLNNPSKFTLPQSEKNQIIELYKEKNPSQFFFIEK